MSRKLKTLVSEDLIRLTLNDLHKKGLMENAEQDAQLLTSRTKREMIKRIEFGSMVALPVISSVVAPKAAMAASGLLGGLSPCTENGQCASGLCNNYCFSRNLVGVNLVGVCFPGQQTCTVPSICLGSGVCSTGGSCDSNGAPCIGFGNQVGVCNFTGVCIEGQAPCFQGFAPRTGTGNCERRCG